ncbi:TPA: ead/Ea22-like family protein [Citrobacter koseri]
MTKQPMTIDKQALREAAEKALPAMQRLLMMPNDELFDEALLNVDGDVDAANTFNLLSGPETVLALLDELEALQSFRTAFNEWHDKTEWVQGDKRFDAIKPWGKHRADVLKLYIDHLESKLEAAKQRNAELVHNHRVHAARLIDERGQLKQRIAELDNSLCELLPGTQYMDPPDGGNVTPLEQVRRMIADYRHRIAELEARTVTIKQFDEFQICHYGATEDYAKGYIDCQNNYNKALNAAGIGKGA